MCIISIYYTFYEKGNEHDNRNGGITIDTNNKSFNEEVYGAKEWGVTFFLLTIPIINIFFLIKWGFVDDREPRKSFIKGYLIVLASYVIIGILMAFSVLLSTNADYSNYESTSEIYFHSEYPESIQITSSKLMLENEEYVLIYEFQVNTEETLKYIFTDIEIVNNEGVIVYNDTIDIIGSFKPNKKYSQKEFLRNVEIEEGLSVNQIVNQVWVE